MYISVGHYFSNLSRYIKLKQSAFSAWQSRAYSLTDKSTSNWRVGRGEQFLYIVRGTARKGRERRRGFPLYTSQSRKSSTCKLYLVCVYKLGSETMARDAMWAVLFEYLVESGLHSWQ